MSQMARTGTDDAVRQVSAHSHEQARVMEEAARAVSGMAEMSARIEELSRTASHLAEEANGQACEGRTELDRLSTVVGELDGLHAELGELARSVRAIQERSRAIQRFAAQARMLALNAQIEAARAGDRGKGFSVVAVEMRELANSSQEAAQEISDAVDDGAGRIEELRGHAGERTRVVREAVGSSRRAFELIADEVHRIAEANHTIARTTLEQASLTRATSESLRERSERASGRAAEVESLLAGEEIPELTPEEAYGALSRFEVIDVRDRKEYVDELGHITGSRCIPIGDELKAALSDLDPSKKYLFVCRSGGRSLRAARLAQAAGLHSSHNLTGGMLRWNEARLPVTKRAA